MVETSGTGVRIHVYYVSHVANKTFLWHSRSNFASYSVRVDTVFKLWVENLFSIDTNCPWVTLVPKLFKLF